MFLKFLIFFRYHQSVPSEVPVLDTKATFGLVSPIDFQMPTPNSLWNLGTYPSLVGVSSAKAGHEHDLPPVKEETIHQSNKEPENESGCTLQ